MALLGLFKPPEVAQYREAGDVRRLAKAARYRQDWTLRRDAVQALHELGALAEGTPEPRIVSALILSLRDGHWKIREMAARALGELGIMEAVQPLIPPTADEHTSVRWAAVGALASLLNRDATSALPGQAVAALIRALRDGAWWVREAAARAIESLADRIQDPELIGWAARWLQDSLRLDDYRIVRQSALNAMIALGAPPTIASLIEALRDEAWSVRRTAADALDALHWKPTEDLSVYYWIAKGECLRCVALGEVAIAPLAALLRDQYLPIQQEAIRALAAVGRAAVPALLQAMDHRYYWTRAAAIEALGMIISQHGDGAVAASPLLAALEDRSKSVRRAAALALGALGTDQALEPLLLLLNDHQATVREAAATALGEIGDVTAAQALMHIGRRDPDWGVRRAAREALAAL